MDQYISNVFSGRDRGLHLSLYKIIKRVILSLYERRGHSVAIRYQAALFTTIHYGTKVEKPYSHKDLVNYFTMTSLFHYTTGFGA